MAQIDRRRFLGGSLAVAGMAAASSPLAQALNLRAAAAAAGRGGAGNVAGLGDGGYGPISPTRPTAAGPDADPDLEWLALPDGFEYTIFGVSGTTMSDGNVTPFAHDGMGAFKARRGRVRLVRNHETRDGPGVVAPPSPENVYDPMAGGGNTTLVIDFDDDGVPMPTREFVSLSGTYVNCAGGKTPWRSWISCEETTAGADDGFEQEHGYVFDIPASADEPVEPVPLKALGRFDHEAVCIHRKSGIVYLTEDNGDSGFYRFLPDERGDLSSGRLQMAAVRGATNYDTRTGQQDLEEPLRIEWVTIEDPDPAGGGSKTVYEEGIDKGGAIFRRLEGCWFGLGAVYFCATDGGDAEHGQVWEYEPDGRRFGDLRLVYESPGAEVLSFPDNITTTPRGGIILCEDTAREPLELDFSEQYLKGLTRRGRVFDFALNLIDDTEWAGACWSPDGEYLFVNSMGENFRFDDPRPSRTYAIWGPWDRGVL